ncbi:LIM domain only protein 7 isoform X2 [Plutella xylostella]|uniref:LIM domain only protein 7 isoform X2 n=1 Tax=Plutella xylostella TaxID=51655 RepID=UPI002032AB4C|nr:LIM domain only protein 7 isoform X2 [Plutella xylostella]
MPSDSGAAWAPPASNGERRLSNSSDGSAGSGYSKALSSDSADFLATRPHTAAVIPGKPVVNPLQFVKVGPADLGSRAREQLRRAELAKRTEPARVEQQEDWQSNLDNWKSSRRKRVEHIIDRVVEVKRLEAEAPPARGKGKTFHEMMEERAGRRRRNHLAYITDDDAHDLSDLGIGTSSTKSSLSEDCDTHSLASDGMDLDKNHSDVDNLSNCDMANRKLGSSANEYDTCTTTTISSPEPEEYTYEGAIEGYKSRIISQTNSSIVKTVVNNNHNKEKSPEKHNGDLNRIRTNVSNKIEEKLSSFQQERANDIKNSNQKKDLPKVNIHKRREQFERENSQETQTNKPKLPEITNKLSIKQRLSSLEKFSEETLVQKTTVDQTKLPLAEVRPLKERLSSLEKVKTGSTEHEVKRVSNGDLTNTRSLKERLSSLQSQTSEEEVKIVKTEIKEVSMSLKERLSCLDAAKNKEIPKISVEEEIHNHEHSETKVSDNSNEGSLKTSLTGIESQMQSFCRSLDSLDINGQSSPNSIERVQSFEDFDAEMHNNAVQSDIETEDSGIHTARDSCAPADDIADLTQVASPIGEQLIEVSEYESSNEDSTPAIVPMSPTKVEEPEVFTPEPIHPIIDDVIIEEVEEQELCKTEDSDSGSNYLQAVSQPEDFSVTSEVTEIQMDKDDEDTLKSLEIQDTSVSLNEPVSTASEGDAVVFEGKMTIHLNLNEICNKSGAGSNPNCNDSTTNCKSMPMVLDALELAFQELDSEDSFGNTSNMSNKVEDQPDTKTEEKTPAEPMEPSKIDVAPLYENIDIFYQNGGSDEAAAFPLDMPSNVLEPPKEKPPPPPADDNVEEELLGSAITRQAPHTSSARRIKKEIRNKRTSFLGISASDEPEQPPPPDITSFLQEETKIEKLLYRKTLGHDMEAGLRDSRDSGVDVDHSHSRQNSEPYTNLTTSSDEDDSSKKQSATFTSNLTSELETLGSDDKIETLDKKIQEQQEVLRFERELLQLEQEELRRQRDNLLRESHTRILQKSVQDISSIPSTPEKPPLQQRPKPTNQNYRHSMPNLLANELSAADPIEPITVERTHYKLEESMKRKPFVSEEHIQRHFGVEESRKILYEGVERRQTVQQVSRPPQPILPPKPKLQSRESVEREITMRSSRVPSAVEYANVERPAVQLRQKPTTQPPPPPQTNGQYHPMSRHTLQALSAAPTPKLMSNAEWLQSKAARPKPAHYNYNQHWLIQEAEQRRIEEHKLKTRAPAQRHSYHHDARDTLAPTHTHRMQALSASQQQLPRAVPPPVVPEDKVLSVSGKRKCSHCGDELGRGAAMIIESLSLCYHVWCFACFVCGARLGDGRAGADVRVRGARLHCRACYSADDGSKYSAV